MIAVAPSRAEGTDASLREAGARLTYVLVIDAEHQAEANVLIAQIPGATCYTIRSNGDRAGELPAGQLSLRLEQVLSLIGQGMSNKTIGRQLGISHFTVRNHVARLLSIYGARNRDELIALTQTHRSV